MDDTVNMSHEEDERGIQCNATNHSMSIQYSAKAMFIEHEEELNDDYSFRGDATHNHSDIEIQNRMMQNHPAVPEAGMQEQLELDIIEKLERI